MSHTLTIRLTDELAEWSKRKSRKTGEPAGCIIRRQLEKAMSETGTERILALAGKMSGPPGLSARKGSAGK